MKDFRTLEERFGSYEINEEGKIRNIKTKKYKAIIHDVRGNAMVVLTDEIAEDHPQVALYVKELLLDYFGIDDDDLFNETKIFNLEKRCERLTIMVENLEAKIKSKGKRKSKVRISCHETRTTFNSYAEAASYHKIPYDKFYNLFYDSKKDEVEFNDLHFIRNFINKED